MDWRIPLAILFAAGVLSRDSPQELHTQPDTSWVLALVDTYDRGDYGEFRAQLQRALRPVTGFRLETVKDALGDRGAEWIRTAPSGQRDRRRLVLAALALEAADTAGATDWHTAENLIEWGCGVVRKTTAPSAGEHAWFAASIALLESAARPDAVDAHGSHALSRFRSDPRFTLARGVAAEARTWPDPRDGRTPRQRNPAASDLAVARLAEASKDAATHAEAEMRLGVVALRNGDLADAHSRFLEAARQTTDPVLLHLTHLFDARAFDRADDLTRAVAAYRAALAAHPGQTASFGLAVALTRLGEGHDAISIATRALTEELEAADPWTEYGRGDGRLWPQLIAQLRRQLR